MMPLPLLLMFACQQPPEDVAGTVLILVMDGVRLEESLGNDPSSATGEMPQEFMPEVWKELVPEGTRADNAWVLSASTTTPAHAAMITGRRVPLANYPQEEATGLYRSELPTLLEEVRRDGTYSAEQSVLLANTELTSALAWSRWPTAGPDLASDFVLVTKDDSVSIRSDDDLDVLEDLRTHMQSWGTRLALVNLHQVDRSGHYGETNDYLDDVRRLDGPIADFWKWVQAHDDYGDDTWLVLLADHGRHDSGENDPIWRHHGCSCNGCRRVPLLVLGPGVRQGETLNTPFLMADVAPTLAPLLGVSLPWADGLVRDDLFEAPTGGQSRSGTADLARAGGHVAELRYRDDPEHRTELFVDEERVSDPDAIAVEAPTMAAAGDQAWLCFREIVLDPQGSETPWLLRCQAHDVGEGWTDMGSPVERVGPYWQGRLLPAADGSVLLAYGYNPNGLAAGGVEASGGSVSVDLARYDGTGWTRAHVDDTHSFPTHGDAVWTGTDSLVLATGGGDMGDHHRDIYLTRAWLRDGVVSMETPMASGLAALLFPGEQAHLEHPALHVDENGRLWLAAVLLTQTDNLPILAVSDDQGRSWTEVSSPTLPGQVAPNLSPLWWHDEVFFATVDPADGAASLCRVSTTGASACEAVNSQRILRLTADEDAIYAIVDAGAGQWEATRWDSQALRR